jgi:hypothetical protein
MPGDRGRNRNAAEESAAWGGTRHSSLAGRRAGPRGRPEFLLGAGPRRLMAAWWAGQSWAGARARRRMARARLDVARPRLVGMEAPDRGKSSVVVGGCDNVGPVPDGVVCRGWSPCSFDWHASAASVGRRVGRQDYRSVPAAIGAGTNIHILSAGNVGSRGATGESRSRNRVVDPETVRGETEHGPREELLPSGQAAGRWHFPPPHCADNMASRRRQPGGTHQ